MPLLIGHKVPDFKADAYHGGDIKQIKLSNYRGKWVILLFYPGDFTFVCPTELQAFAENYQKFRKEGAEVLAVSVDSVWSHKVWHETSKAVSKVKYPMLSDINKEMSRMFGVLDEESGIALRGLFIIDPKGILQAATVYNAPVGRNVDEALRTLLAFKFTSKTGYVCPINWTPGKKALKPGPKLAGKI